MKEYEISEGSQPSEMPEAIPNWQDLRKYGAIISEIVNTLKSLTSLAVGAIVKLQTIKIRIGSIEIEYDLGSIKRVK